MDTSTNSIDYLVTLAKGGAGMIPFVGGFVAEFIGTIVPNQQNLSRFKCPRLPDAKSRFWVKFYRPHQEAMNRDRELKP